MRLDCVRLQVELGFKDDKFLSETVWVWADEMGCFEVCFLFGRAEQDQDQPTVSLERRDCAATLTKYS